MAEDPPSESPRRRFLAALGAGSITGVAGCRSRSANDDDTASGSGTATRPESESAGTATEATGAREPTGTDPAEAYPQTSTDASNWAEGGPPDRDRWSVTFADDFGAGTLDRSKWAYDVGYQYSCPNASLECFAQDHVWVDEESERLVIETSEESPEGGEYTAGALNTRGHFEQEFGYFEAKARPPVQPGALPAFWAWWNAEDWTYRREIDVYEVVAPEPRVAQHNVHVDCEHRESGGAPAEWTGGRTTLDGPANERFRIWGCEWAPESVTFYVDGDPVLRRDDDVIGDCLAGEAMWVVLTSAVKDEFGDPAEATYPYTHEFEWVRVWQRDEW